MNWLFVRKVRILAHWPINTEEFNIVNGFEGKFFDGIL